MIAIRLNDPATVDGKRRCACCALMSYEVVDVLILPGDSHEKRICIRCARQIFQNVTAMLENLSQTIAWTHKISIYASCSTGTANSPQTKGEGDGCT